MKLCVRARCPSVLLAAAVLLVHPVAAWSQPIDWFPGGRYEHAVGFGQDVHLVTIDLCAPGVSVRTTDAGERGRTVSSFGRAVGAAMAVNGDFFAPGYNPDGPAMGNGHLWGGVDHTYVAPLSFGLHGVHIPHHALTEGPAPFATQVISGHPTLLDHGVTVGNPDDPLCTNGNPRTAIGITADHRTLLVLVADGRRPGVIGMTCDLAAALLRDHGAYDAVNLDGGGSATLYHGFLGVVNRPSDGRERVVANHLAILATGSGEAPQCPVREPRCPVTGRSLVCTDRTHVAPCFEGVLSPPGDCAAYGALCSTVLPTGVGCASAFCVSGPTDPPRDHEACLPDGRILHCLASGGADNPRACSAGAVCQSDGSSAVCTPPGTVTPRDGGADVPMDARTLDVAIDRPTEDARVTDVPGRPPVIDAAVMAGDVAPTSVLDGGCGCRTASAPSSAAGGFGCMALFALAARRGRRAKRRRGV
jgi:MYXO-CTERM domain-containing protein